LKVLLTGATGSLGRKFLGNLLEASNEVMTLGRNSSKINHPLVKHHSFDFLKSKDLDLDFTPDAIVHLAGLASAEGSSQKEYFQINSESVRILVDWGNRKQVRKFIYSSSASVYGTGEHWSEDSPCLGQSFYALSKIRGEQELLNFHNNFIIFRIASVYGKDTKSYIQKLINLSRKGLLPFPKTGRMKRSFVNIEDVCVFLLKALGGDKAGVYNLAHPEVWVYQDIVKMISESVKKTGKKPPRFIYLPEFLKNFEEKFQSFLRRPSRLKPLFETSTVSLIKLEQDFGLPSRSLKDFLEELDHFQ
jgi:UDP-glucose 4-epimerase